MVARGRFDQDKRKTDRLYLHGDAALGRDELDADRFMKRQGYSVGAPQERWKLTGYVQDRDEIASLDFLRPKDFRQGRVQARRVFAKLLLSGMSHVEKTCNQPDGSLLLFKRTKLGTFISCCHGLKRRTVEAVFSAIG